MATRAPHSDAPRARRSRPSRPQLVAAGLVVLALLAGALWLGSALRTRDALRAAHPEIAGRLALAGVESPVQIDRDRRGVPHIEAASESDAFFALGFSHGQDRLGQLVLLRRQAHGTAAEQTGPDAVAGDRLARLIDFRGLAERQWNELPRGARRVLEAYAAGVDARIERVRSGAAAPPAGLRADEIEPWRPEDSLALYKLFAWGLSSSIDASLVLNALVETLGPVDAGRFFPPRGEASGGARTTAGLGVPQPRTTAGVAPWVGEGDRALRGAWGLAGFGVGSSAFVVAGAKGAPPLLVADSHFAPTDPAALYLAHLRSPGLDVAGATLPGVPVFWWGRNADLAWACVHAGVVVTDLYTETLRREGSEYHDGRRWRPVEERVEALRVRGGKDVSLPVRRTVRGPLLPPGSAGEAIAVAWSGARVDGASGIGSLLGVARAADAAALRAALRTHHEPPIAVVFAAASGEAGLQVTGWIPERSLASQLLPLPGRARWYDWQDAVAFEALPAADLGEARRFVVAADQPLRAAALPNPIDATWRSGARTARLEALLADAVRQGADLRRLALLQTDVVLERSRALLDAALGLLGDAPRGVEAGELEQILRGWDGRAAAESPGAAVYHAYLDVLSEALFAERLGAELYERYLAVPDLDLEGLVLGVLRDAAEGGRDAWSEPDAVRRAVADSLRETWLALSFRLGPDPRQWQWGRIHRLRFARPADPQGALRPLLGPYAYGGAPHAVLAGAYSAADPFEVRVASTARFAIDTAALDLALTSLAPGQSEHPGHPHYRDGVADWLAGRYALLATRRLEIDDRSVAQLVLEPVP